MFNVQLILGDKNLNGSYNMNYKSIIVFIKDGLTIF